MGASAASGIGLSSKQRSPKNWSGSRIAITASLPCSDTTVSFTLPFGGPKRKFLIELLHGEPIAPKHAPSSLQNGIELFIADADRRFFSDFEIFGDALTQRALASPRTT
jgi:hypothetical protein